MSEYESFASVPNIKNGVKIASGDGVNTVFTIAHGSTVTAAPKTAFIQEMSNDALGSKVIAIDAINITVTYAFAPPPGTNNVVLAWVIFN